MAFDQQQFELALENLLGNQKEPLPLHYFESIPSTNTKLWELLDQGATPPRVVIANQQTAGRGQWGRQWQSQPGGLYLSFALSLNIPAANAAHLTLSSAWGIATALRNYKIPVLLKWPNDLVLGRYKLGGIKSETRVQHHKITQAVVGVGINWTNSVPDMGITLQSFFKDSVNPSVNSLEMLAAITVYGLGLGYQRYTLEGIESLLPSYLELLSHKGCTVKVNGCPGVIIGITPTGDLKVRLHSQGTASDVALKPGTISLGYDS